MYSAPSPPKASPVMAPSTAVVAVAESANFAVGKLGLIFMYGAGAVPATVMITPLNTDRTTKLSVSAMYSAPDCGCTATASGVLRYDAFAGPPLIE
jgi:hypothetical protein